MATARGINSPRTAIVPLLLLLLALQARCQADKITRRGSSDSSTNFHHRAYHSSVVVNNSGIPYLYIDGGEITTWSGKGHGLQSTNGSSQPTGGFQTIPDRNTYAVSLDSSWTADNVEIMSISKPDDYATFVYEALWPDVDGNSFYSYNGGLSFALQFEGETDPSANRLWKFTPNVQNVGQWSLATPSPDSNYSLLTRSMESLQTSHKGLSFALGGTQSSATSFSWQDRSMDVPGMVMYNESSQQWWNISTTGYSWQGTARDGAAHFVPSFGPQGLLFVFGGYSNNQLTSFDEAHMFEPISQQWRKQQVSGTPPSPASGQCVVGVQGENGTYEIFLYGGLTGDIASTVTQGSVWSLTLPAFHWQQHSFDSTYGRWLHSCNIPGDGGQQMLVLGGITATEASTLDNIPLDPWAHGIGVYDLSALNWKDGFDADAANYITPDVIKAYYQTNGSFPVAWTDDGVEAWFTKQQADGDGSSNPVGTAPSPSRSRPDDADKGGSTSAGVIAGSVIGAIAGLGILLGIAWLLFRRRRKTVNQAHFELDDSHVVVELPAESGMKEMPARHSWLAGRYKGQGRRSVYELESPIKGAGHGEHQQPHQQQH